MARCIGVRRQSWVDRERAPDPLALDTHPRNNVASLGGEEPSAGRSDDGLGGALRRRAPRGVSRGLQSARIADDARDRRRRRGARASLVGRVRAHGCDVAVVSSIHTSS